MTVQAGPSTAETLPDHIVRRYRDQGFVHVPNVLSEDEVAAFRAASDELLRKETPTIWGADEAEAQVHYIEEAWLKSDTLRGLALHPRLIGLARRLAGGPLRLYSSDVLVKKPREALPTLVHDDEAGLPLANLSRTLTAWVALVDVPVERGCLSYVPGSHLRPDSDRQIRMESFADYRPMEEVWPDFPWRPRVSVPLRAGDVAFHHFRTVHMAGPNTTDVPRMAHGVIYADEEATYQPGVQDQYLTHFQPGQRLGGEKFPPVG
ncbi:Ectoine hydroxylase-related dioxygenase, phytanoyl-CoA dioxygenase (PhyH) family [Thermomonospora echinospora]|uniref:Ectoine hydroxylase-related dioxygenase, phytanoyl-CoA dioxygenase (PhyH) family n=1 Tax=Thermomonospora echinospora TaxID=1992 RepID=A0A1H5TSP5_9ACTN|nr:phytanoyl-CoA dioxygenase family protein [Thermomonospora echinospora]SEF65790.1 Ectoine hydroxylase-related dioxygenase, phytanoyl-CoA dioxygenase (PhyH) family [Thermomonospora echinospora]